MMASPTRLMVDAKNVLTLAHNLVSSKQTRHITRRDLILREREVEGHNVVTHEGGHAGQHCGSLDQGVGCDPIPFERLRRMLLNVLAVGAIYPVPRARRLAAKRGGWYQRL